MNKILKESYGEIPDCYSPFLHRLISSLLEKEEFSRPMITDILDLPEFKEQVYTPICPIDSLDSKTETEVP